MFMVFDDSGFTGLYCKVKIKTDIKGFESLQNGFDT